MTTQGVRSIGAPLERLEGHAKVTGNAPYAFEHPVRDPLYLHPVQSTIARGRIRSFDVSAAENVPGVVAILTYRNAPRFASDEDRELWVLQSDEIAYRGQYVAAVVAESSESAREAAELVQVFYDEQPHDVQLRSDGDLYAPEVINAGFPTDTSEGDVEKAFATAEVTLEQTYSTPMEHNNPLEPHTTVAIWGGPDGEDGLTLYESSQGVHVARGSLAPLLGLAPEKIRVIAPHVGGGFGSKISPHPPTALAALTAKALPGRPVKFALTRQQMFATAGFRAPIIQHIRLASTSDGTLTALEHDSIQMTSRIKEYVEQTGTASRMMYATPNRRVTHRAAALDVPVPCYMRAPGEAPGMFAAEVALDELAEACGVDPVDLRLRNEPDVDPETGRPWSTRNLTACLQEGARLFGWSSRAPAPAVRREGAWLVGTGVASAVYPNFALPGSTATVRYGPEGYAVQIGAADIGTGSRTALTQIAADALDCSAEEVHVDIGDTRFPAASPAGGSTGLTMWGSSIVDAARAFRDKFGMQPDIGDQAEGAVPDDPDAEKYSTFAFGAQFAEARVHVDTGEIRVPRMQGVFTVGRVINPRTTRSQLIGGMTMGLSMALHECSVMDPRFGHVINHDFGSYHIPSHADIGSIEAECLDEFDEHASPMGAKGAGEIGIVGTAAAVANATYHATGIRVRDLPITPDKFVR